jgi:DNA-binding transcriptional regulator YiaG
MENTNSFNGKNILEIRNQRGLSRNDVVFAMHDAGTDITEETLTRWENGVTRPNAEWLGLLSNILKCRIDDFYK